MATKRNWRILVSGVGSVGERHIRNLLALGQTDIAVHRRRKLPYRTLDREFRSFEELEDALRQWEPEVVLVTGPTASHLAVAIRSADAGCHVFVEKPLSHTMDGVDRLRSALAANRRQLMVGYMLRFHPLLGRLQQWLATGVLGRPLYWRSSWGEYLPDWHPWEDYRTSYAARRDLGGGPALTLSHDIDIAMWFFGAVDVAYALPLPESPLRIDGPPGVELMIKHENGVVASVHLDFLQRPTQRTYELVGTRGRANLDYCSQRLARFAHPETDQPSAAALDIASPAEVVTAPDGWNRNDMFMDEMRHFLSSLENAALPVPGLDAGVAATQLALVLGEGGVWKRDTTAGAT